MRIGNKRLSMATLALTAAVVLGACTATDVGAATDPTGGQPGTSIVAPEPTTAQTPEPEPATPSAPVGPLDEFRSRIFGGLAGTTLTEVERNEAALNRALAQFVAACMAEQGFTFIAGEGLPNVGIGLGAPAQEETGPIFGTREWAQQYGFGFSTDAWANTGRNTTTGSVLDPNAEQVAAMSDAERAAWDVALSGEPPDLADLAAWNAQHPAGIGGCQGQAIAAYLPMMTNDEQFVGLRNEMNRLADVVAADPRMFELNVAWASCMADHGFTARPDRDEFWFTDVQNEWFALTGRDVLLTWDWEHSPEGPPEPDRSLIPAFREREIAMAVADYDCLQQVSWVETQRAIDFDHQQQFVDLHRNELEAWAQQMEARREGWAW